MASCLTDHDVLVVGSGPAALSAALVCARAKYRVLVVTSSGCQTSRACESMPPGFATLLGELGARDVLTSATRGFYTGVWRDGRFTLLGRPPSGDVLGIHIDRRAFDSSLGKLAESAGAEIVVDSVVDAVLAPERVVGVRTRLGTRTARFIIDGSGRRAVVARRLFQRQTLSIPLMAWTARLHNVDFTDREPRFVKHDDGWSWVAPESDGRATWTRLSERRCQPDLLPGSKVTGLQAKSVCWRLTRPVVSVGLIAVGDAAGVLDPGSGQGVFRAMRSGIAAGQTVVECLEKPAFAPSRLAKYDAWFLSDYLQQMSELRERYRW